MNQVQNISFHGQTVPVFSHNNQHYVAMKPIVENIGLDWVSQYKKIQRSEILKSGMVMMTIPATDGKTYETACLPLDYLNGWLFGVDARRVKPEIRSRLLTYQRECFRVLNEHFNKRPALPATREDLWAQVREEGFKKKYIPRDEAHEEMLNLLHRIETVLCKSHCGPDLEGQIRALTGKKRSELDFFQLAALNCRLLDGMPALIMEKHPEIRRLKAEHRYSFDRPAENLPALPDAAEKNPRPAPANAAPAAPMYDEKRDRRQRDELAQRYESDIASLLLYYGEATDRKNEWAQRIKCDALMQTAHLTRVLNEVWNNFIHNEENQSLSDYDFKQAILELNRLHCTISDAANGW